MKQSLAKVALYLLMGLSPQLLLSADTIDGKSAEEIAKELANPNTPLTSVKFELQYTAYEGTLLNANSQDKFIVNLQPTLPFPIDEEHTLWVRPAVPLVFNQPTFNPSTQEYDSTFGIADMIFDFQYGKKASGGWYSSYGGSITLPTATDENLGLDKWTAGPGFQVGYLGKQTIFGGFINHQWSFAGAGEKDVSFTTAQFFAVYLPGGGWSVASGPIITYDHENSQATIPINLAVGKTVIFNGRPWKLAIEANYFVEKADDFGADFMIGINIAPVMKNKLVNWFR
jgi:hypothetical protein